MAERRMFAKTIIDSDAFIEMPMSARLLYYDLAMRADDDGFNNSPKKVMRTIGASTDDINILIARKFIIPFENGVVVIKHWRIHNYIRKDTYNETPYKEQKSMLELDENNAYRLACDEGCQAIEAPSTSRRRAVDEPSTQDRLGKDRLDKDSIEEEPKTRKAHPTLEEVKAYCEERKNGIDAEQWFNFYASKGWMVGRSKMVDWKAAVRTWERRGGGNNGGSKSARHTDYDVFTD